jgi:hypothetical protein
MRATIFIALMVAALCRAADKVDRRVERKAEVRGGRVAERVTERTVTTTAGKGGKKGKSTTNEVTRAGREFPVMFVTPRIARKDTDLPERVRSGSNKETRP